MAFAPPPRGHHRPLDHCPIALWGLLRQENRRPFIRGLSFRLCSLRRRASGNPTRETRCHLLHERPATRARPPPRDSPPAGPGLSGLCGTIWGGIWGSDFSAWAGRGCTALSRGPALSPDTGAPEGAQPRPPVEGTPGTIYRREHSRRGEAHVGRSLLMLKTFIIGQLGGEKQKP